MAQPLAARVTCPTCQTQFQVRVEQVLDVRADPSAKTRLLSGMVNMIVCPNCQAPGSLNLPFLYHDPSKDLALIYMPMESGGDNLERQAAIGRLTQTAMEGLPPEERKGYLLQPQVFLTLENLTKEVLKADGITEEMLEAQHKKAELLQRLVDAPAEGVLEAMIEEHDAEIDADMFRLLAMNLQMMEGARRAQDAQQLMDLRSKMLEFSTEGRKIRARGEVLEKLREDPTREKLLDLLIKAPDKETREVLVSFGLSLVDYLFFQTMTKRIEGTTDEQEKHRLTELRKEILAVRDQIEEAVHAEYEERSSLLRDLLLSDEPEPLARQRISELDDVFMNVLSGAIRDARSAGNEEAVKHLEEVWQLVMRLMEESIPPELRLINRLMAIDDLEAVENLLRERSAVITDRLIGIMERVEANLRQEKDAAEADHLKAIIEIAKRITD
ncbi:MAG: hypothetical protein GX620_14505 [Chloroflexi bacterium]|nr:hypothetical protein [Chloroflexota bacterium]